MVNNPDPNGGPRGREMNVLQLYLYPVPVAAWGTLCSRMALDRDDGGEEMG